MKRGPRLITSADRDEFAAKCSVAVKKAIKGKKWPPNKFTSASARRAANKRWNSGWGIDY